MHRLAVEPDGAGAAIAGVAALLDAEAAVVAQEGAQALAGKRLAETDRPLMRVFGRRLGDRSCRLSLRELGADLLGEVVSEVALVGGRAVHVAEPALVGDPGIDRLAQLGRCGACGEAELDGPVGRGGDGQQEVAGRHRSCR